MRQAHPRVLHIAFNETDDWAHDRKYNRVLDAIGYLDRSLSWQVVKRFARVLREGWGKQRA
jgi:hypothetical protein